MSFLDEEARQKLSAMMEEAPEAPTPEPPPTPVEPSDSEVEVSSQEAQDVNESVKEEAPQSAAPAEPEGEVEVEVEEGHRVPYNRFKQVLDARNSHRDEVESLRQEIEALRSHQDTRQQQQPQQVQSAPRPQVQPQEDDWWSEFQSEAGVVPDAPAAPDPQIAQIQQRLEAQEVAFQKMILERELSAAVEKYPSLDKRQILQAVHQNPALPVMQVAEQYSTWLAGIEEAAIARHLSENPQPVVEDAKEAAPQAPPRPPQSGASTAASRFVGEKKPATIEEGSHMLREFLKTHNPFAT